MQVRESSAEWRFQNYMDHLDDLGYDLRGGAADGASLVPEDDEPSTSDTDRRGARESAVA